MNIAIVGSGVSGLTAAWYLSKEHEVTVFEADPRAGGHANTQVVGRNGTEVAVDTGFIVFNERVYKGFTALLKELGVGWCVSDMSFGVSDEKSGLAYTPSSFNGWFAQRTNLFRPRFWAMIREAIRFQKESLSLLSPTVPPVTLGEYLAENHYSELFRECFVVPMGAAIWSAPRSGILEFPARLFVRFFDNHQFLNYKEQPQWLTLPDRSIAYVKVIQKHLAQRLKLGSPVAAVRRDVGKVVLHSNGEEHLFDRVVLATHSDQALAILADPSDAEREILQSFPYQPNKAVVHTDPSQLPANRRAWASWNYRVPAEETGAVTVTYNMNRLQHIPAPAPLCLTLNADSTIPEAERLYETDYMHPAYTLAGEAAQERHGEISNTRNTHYCGAYWGYGFHEDGVQSGLRVCREFSGATG